MPLAAVRDSFVQWCRQTEEDFQLIHYIDAQLAERKRPSPLTKTLKQWRETAKQSPQIAKAWGFKDDPKLDENTSLTLNAESIPVWAPGWDMRRGKP